MRTEFDGKYEHEDAVLKRCLRSLWLAVALAMAAIIAAPTGAQGAELPTFTIVLKDGKLHPATLEVPAHTRFKIVLRNEGSSPAEFESRALGREKVLAPGASSFVVVAPQKPGEYDMFDEYHPDTSRGRIVVKAPR